jgi:iron complex outermembrane receptor protein
MRWGLTSAIVAGVVCLLPAQSLAQEPDDSSAVVPEPVPPAADELPAVEVIHKEPGPAPETAQKKPAPKKKEAAAPAASEVAGTGGIDSGTVMMSPVSGSDIPIGKYPGAVGRANADDIARSGDSYAPQVLQQTVPSAILSDAQGNVFQRGLQYRGFDASPVNGQAQGIAVYQNGVRINESFGDIVNWDFLPDAAIDGISIVGANPVFGLNAIGGAAVIVMRDGFNFQGAELDIRGGSYGHIQSSLALGGTSGNWGLFLAVEGIKDDGFRDFSEAELKRTYADIGVKGDGSEFHLNFTGAKNFVGVTAAAPEELLDLGWERTFTSPQTTDNDMQMLSFNGSVKATPTLTISGVTYYRWFDQKHDDGNIAEAEACEAADGNPPGKVCFEAEEPGGLPEPAEWAGGTIDFDDDLSYGTIDRTTQSARSYGVTLQGVEKSRAFGLPNQFLMGASYDHGEVAYTANSELGFFGPKLVVNLFDERYVLTGPDDFVPRDLTTKNDYVGVYVSNTLELTRALALTVGGRFNYAHIEIENKGFEDDPNDPNNKDTLSGKHDYYRFNPMAGATYKLSPGLTLYGSYAEANRAPTAAELACADPEDPCLIESFLTADPPLKQVVSRTFELGLRGQLASFGDGRKLAWTAGAFRTENEDDIIAIASESNGRGYFANAGNTLRQGVEAGVRYEERRFMAYANYAFIDATFRSSNVFSSPDNPNESAYVDCETGGVWQDDDPVCIQVNSGDRLPGIPRHRFKAGFDFWLTRQWSFGADLVAASDQVFFGDEGNDNATLDGYAKVDIRTAYNLTESVQVYGLINNLFDSRYGLLGAYYNREAAQEAAEADGSLDSVAFGNARSIVPAPPITFYGGLKVRY